MAAAAREPLRKEEPASWRGRGLLRGSGFTPTDCAHNLPTVLMASASPALASPRLQALCQEAGLGASFWTSGWKLPPPGPGVPGPPFLLMPCSPAHRGAQAEALCRVCLLDLTRGNFSILREMDEP